MTSADFTVVQAVANGLDRGDQGLPLGSGQRVIGDQGRVHLVLLLVKWMSARVTPGKS